MKLQLNCINMESSLRGRIEFFCVLMKGVIRMMKKTVSLCLVLSMMLSILLVPVNADNNYGSHNVSDVKTEEITIHVPPDASAAVPYGWVGSGAIIQYPVGTVNLNSWVYITITDNSSGIPVIVQLYTGEGARYDDYTLTKGTVGWQIDVTAAHYILITNDNNIGTDVSFYLTYY